MGQLAALEVLAAACNPESDVAGSTPLNPALVGIFSDINFFHDREERVAIAAEHDAAIGRPAPRSQRR